MRSSCRLGKEPDPLKYVKRNVANLASRFSPEMREEALERITRYALEHRAVKVSDEATFRQDVAQALDELHRNDKNGYGGKKLLHLQDVPGRSPAVVGGNSGE